MTTLAFIVPVRHQENAVDWGQLKSRLAQTIASISAQTGTDWRAVIVANHGADLPPLPDKFYVEYVDFPPNRFHGKGDADRNTFLDAFRMDKGRRVLKGMLRLRDSSYFMVVDDDDFVSSKICEFVDANKNTGKGSGWFVGRGYVWTEGGKWLLKEDDFNHVCGSSLIIHSAVYQLPDKFEDAHLDLIMNLLGSHHGVQERLAAAGVPLKLLPFRGAVYRVGSSGSHSGTPGLAEKLFRLAIRGRIKTLVSSLVRVRRLDRSRRNEFFGSLDIKTGRPPLRSPTNVR